LVERWHLEYRIAMAKKGKCVKNLPGAKQHLFQFDSGSISTGTGDKATNGCDDTERTDPSTDISDLTKSTINTDEAVVEIEKPKRKGGRPKGSTDENDRLHDIAIAKALTIAATKCFEAKQKALESGEGKVKEGTYKQLIAETELECGLEPGDVKFETVRSRVMAKNPSGTALQCVSPLYMIEPLLSDFVVQLARLGEAQTKYEIFDLANDLIKKTVHASAYIEFCEKRQIYKNWEESIVGERWYRNFMKRYEHKIKRARCRVQDNNRRSYCTYENFCNMYDCVYNNMVEAGVAIKHEEEVMFDKNGHITTDEKEMYGRPSKYQIIRPDRCVFVDETGCNTNCKNDGLIGGQRLVTGVNQVEGARTSATTDLHFTVLAFTSGTGEPIMCALILKSDKPVEEMPANWKLGLDATIEIIEGEDELDTYNKNVINGVAKGGPRCILL
jgi:hypothetical protein